MEPAISNLNNPSTPPRLLNPPPDPPHNQSLLSAPANPAPAPAPKPQPDDTPLDIPPPPVVDNAYRFHAFIDRINLRQWSLLSASFHPRLRYNHTDVSLFQLTTLLRDEFAPKTGAQVDVVALVGGRGDAEGVAARLRVRRIVRGERVYCGSRGEAREYARHMVLGWEGEKIAVVFDVSEDEGPGRILPLPGLRPPPPRVSVDLQAFYREYLECINEGRMDGELARFVKDRVVWNGTAMEVGQYAGLMKSSFEAIQGLEFKAHTVLVDEDRQMLTVRIEFAGTPVKPYGGAIPNGKPVSFAEHAFYWLEQSRISDVLTIIDWEAYRVQMG
ncbi:hypothetical protein B0H67DRAFT_572555 [Lasiosphaeris hirsuta]|uniref:SnoaL-like domain-containing protein n=1 Tax=Lasiosphaeris hirsuta TaxID=260670 RepID=A0AA40ANS7_9PEZI|nr:hypothetical protein B0H67DRAFT_572555 [Lasiosphaeris hirsuta]